MMSCRRLRTPFAVSRALSLNSEIALQLLDPFPLSCQFQQSRIDPLKSRIQSLLGAPQGPADLEGQLPGLLELPLKLASRPGPAQQLQRGSIRRTARKARSSSQRTFLERGARVKSREMSFEAHDEGILSGNLARIDESAGFRGQIVPVLRPRPYS